MISASGSAAKLSWVLCVDDEPSILRSLQWLLKKDFQVMSAPSGQAALALLRQHDFDVIVSDQRMPGMMGSEFLREARRISPRSMRILLTGYSDLEAILRSVNDGEVFRFVHKPWSTRELPKIIADAAAISKLASAEFIHGDGSVPESRQEAILIIDDDPAMRGLVAEAAGAHVEIVHTTALAEAVKSLANKNVGIVISDTRVSGLDTTTMLKVLKQQRPDIVAVVYTSAVDAADAVTLINQGQIFRFLPKPVKMVTLKQALLAAALKRRQLCLSPGIAGRHAVENVAEDAKEELVRTICQSAGPAASTPETNALLRFGSTLKRMFASS